MSSARISSPNKIGGAYNDLIAQLKSAGEDADSFVSCADNFWQSGFRSPDGRANPTFTMALYLKKWPCRHLKRKRLDIVVKALETYAQSEQAWFLSKSIVHLNYFVVSDSEVNLAQALHYDFEDGGKVSHPIFHLQLTNELIDEADIRSARCDLELPDAAPPSDCRVTTRIPTADMTLPSMLFCLAANHLEPHIFSQFSEKVLPILNDRLPSPNFDALMGSLSTDSGHFKSPHWFAHMRDGTPQEG